MNGQDENRDFDRVSKALRAGDSELPPPGVDQAVLRQASDALKNERTRVRVWHRWLVSGALAATLVLSVSLTVQLMIPETAIMSTALERDAQPGKPGRAASVAANTPAVAVQEKQADTAVSRKSLANDRLQTPAEAPARQNLEESVGIATTDADELAPGSMALAPEEARVRGQSHVADNDKLAVIDGAILAAEGAVEVTGSSVKRVDVEGPHPVTVITTEDLETSSYATVGALRAEPETSSMSMAQYSEIAKADAHELRRLVEAQQEQDREEFLASYLDSDEFRQAVYGNPDRWLAGIADLIDMGEVALARNELDEFRVAYPDYELDERFQL